MSLEQLRCNQIFHFYFRLLLILINLYKLEIAILERKWLTLPVIIEGRSGRIGDYFGLEKRNSGEFEQSHFARLLCPDPF